MQVPEPTLSLPITSPFILEYNSNTITLSHFTATLGDLILDFDTSNLTDDFSITYTTSYNNIPETHSFGEGKPHQAFFNFNNNLIWDYDPEMQIMTIQYENEDPSDFDPWEITIQSITVGNKTYTSFDFAQ